MRTYIIYCESGDSFEVQAPNKIAAISGARITCKHLKDRFVNAKLKR